MSIERKMRTVAELAATEAAARERARCLWCLEQVLENTKQKARSKLRSASEEVLVELRIKLAEALCGTAKALIISGIRPATPIPPSADAPTTAS